MERRTLVLVVCILGCVSNVAVTAGLAAGGVLKTTQQGDITEFREFEADGTRYALDEGSQPFVGEPVTDVDAFYNAARRIESDDVPLYGVATDAIQAYRYAPVVAGLFAPLTVFGYVPFKFLVLFASALSVAGGSYAVLRVETDRRGITVSQGTLAGIAVATVGFGPVVSNLKVGQISPFIYAAVAGFWVAHRRGYSGVGGALLLVPALTKPYFLAPAAVVIARRHCRGVLGLGVGVATGLLASVLVAGTGVTVEYLHTVAAFATGTEATGVPDVAEWSVEAVYPFASLTGVALIGRIAATLGFAGLWIRYLQNGAADRDAVGVFAASLVFVPFVVQEATNIDLAVLLGAYLVLGVELYDRRRTRAVAALAVSFLLCHGHWYVMEVVVGRGHTNLLEIVPTTAVPLLQLLQPAAYALYLLAALSVLVVVEGRLTDTE